MRIWVLAGAFLLASVGPVRAELMFDVYGGASTGKIDLDQQITVPGGNATSEIRDLDQATRFTGGLRTTYWLEQVPWLGFGVDAFYVATDIHDQVATGRVSGPGGSAVLTGQISRIDVNAFGVGLDLLKLRVPFDISADYPSGRVQPMISIGPALFLSEVKDTNNFSPNGQSQRDTSIGFKVNTGITSMLTPTVGLFAEYRFLYFTAEAPLVERTVNAQISNDFTFYNHAILAGLSFRLGGTSTASP